MIRRFVSLSLGLCVAALAVAGCQPASQVTWENNGQPYHVRGEQNWWHYQFVYYPDTQVYFEPYSQQYHWFQDGRWRQGETLPAHLKPHSLNGAQVVFLDTNRPGDQHGTVVAWYPHPEPWLQSRYNALADDLPDYRYARWSDD